MAGDFVFGTLSSIRAYVKVLRPQHFFKKYQGFGISITELAKIRDSGVKLILIKYIGSTTTYNYLSRPEQWFLSEITHEDQSNGYSDFQKVLGTKEMWELG